MSQLHDDLKTLAKAGKRAEVRTLLAKAGDNPSYTQIQNDDQLSDEGKRHQLAAAYLGRLRSVENQVRKMAAGVVLTDRDDAERVFGTKGLPGDPASLVISRRDAGDRVAEIVAKDELQTLLRRATRSGDEVLARACVERAVELKYDTVVNEFSAARPNLEAAVDRLWDVDQAETNTFETGLLLAGLRPAELQGATIQVIEQLAEPKAAAEPARNAFQAPGHFVDQPAGFTQGDIWGSDPD